MSTISRQLKYQREHKANGLCTLCPRPLDPESSKLCAIHRASNRARYGNKTVRGKTRWKLVDWSLRDFEIAAYLNVTIPAVRYQRRKFTAD